jgi:hypothetical protein
MRFYDLLTFIPGYDTLLFHPGESMYIPSRTLVQMISKDDITRAGFVSYAPVIKGLHTSYCRPMTVNGLCTENCENCRPAIERAMKSIDPATAKNVNALWSWTVRRESARAAEATTAERKVTVQTNRFGEKTGVSVWDQIV